MVFAQLGALLARTGVAGPWSGVCGDVDAERPQFRTATVVDVDVRTRRGLLVCGPPEDTHAVIIADDTCGRRRRWSDRFST